MPEHAPHDLISVAAAVRLCGRLSTKTLERYAARGLFRIHQTPSGPMISRSALRRAPVLLVGRLATLAGCHAATVRRRIKAGVITPTEIAGSSIGRFTLRDVDRLRKALVGHGHGWHRARRHSQNRGTPAPTSRGAPQPAAPAGRAQPVVSEMSKSLLLVLGADLLKRVRARKIPGKLYTVDLVRRYVERGLRTPAAAKRSGNRSTSPPTPQARPPGSRPTAPPAPSH